MLPIFAAPSVRKAIYIHAAPYISASTGLDENVIFNAHNDTHSLRDKDAFLIAFIEAIMDPHLQTGTPADDQTLLKYWMVFACWMKGLFLMCASP